MKFTINEKFQRLLPKLSPMEEETLMASIESEGQREPIIVWANHDNTIIDGHNRARICEKLGKTPKFKALTFKDEAEVMKWMYSNQQGRRNMTPQALSILRGQVYLARKQSHGGDRKSKQTKSRSKNKTLKTDDTATQVASEMGVTRATVFNDAKKAEKFNELKTEEERQAMLAPAKKTEKPKESTKQKKEVALRDVLAKASAMDSVTTGQLAKMLDSTDQHAGRLFRHACDFNGYTVIEKSKNVFSINASVTSDMAASAGAIAGTKETLRSMRELLLDSNSAGFKVGRAMQYVEQMVEMLADFPG